MQSPIRVVILGGGFGGLYTARHLSRLVRGRRDVQVTLVSRENYFLMTPLLFEASSGVLEPRHAVNPIRPLLKDVRFIKAEVEGVDLDGRKINARLARDEPLEIGYDQLVLALGGITNRAVIPGAEHARTFKVLGDAISLRNHVINAFELADIEKDRERKREHLTFAIVGAGLVAVELAGELTVFIKTLCTLYRNITPDELRIEMIEAGPRIAPEFEEPLADYARRTLEARHLRIRVNTRVERIAPGHVHLSGGETIAARTIVVATGVAPSPLVASLPIEHDKKGRVLAEPTMRSRGRNEVWALGDCAAIPNRAGGTYPSLAQHALREAKCLARNIDAVLRDGDAAKLEPFVYRSKGSLAALGHFKGIGNVNGLRIHGFIAWWVWRTYYLFQMPHWNRRLRVMLDWTIDLFFHNDVVELDLSVEGSPPAKPLMSPSDHSTPHVPR